MAVETIPSQDKYICDFSNDTVTVERGHFPQGWEVLSFAEWDNFHVCDRCAPKITDGIQKAIDKIEKKGP